METQELWTCRRRGALDPSVFKFAAQKAWRLCQFCSLLFFVPRCFHCASVVLLLVLSCPSIFRRRARCQRHALAPVSKTLLGPSASQQMTPVAWPQSLAHRAIAFAIAMVAMIYWYLLICIDILWYLLISINIYWYPLISIDIYWYLLISTDIYWYLLISTDIYWFLLICSVRS